MKKVAIILSRVPFPLTKGDKLRAFFQIKELSKKCEIHLFCLSENNNNKIALAELSKYCKQITIYKLNKFTQLKQLVKSVFSKKPFQVHYFFQHKIAAKIKNEIEPLNFDAVFFQMIRTAEYAKKINHPNKVLDFMDALSAGMQRRIKENNSIKKSIIKKEFERLTKYEKNVFTNFNKHCIISQADKFEIKLPKVKVIQNGVDFNFFKPDYKVEKIYDLAFVGNMNYPPNINCCEFIVNKILPKLNIKVKVLLAGINPNVRVKNLASENVIVSGYLKDIRTAYNKSKIFLAPLQIGTGLQNKILEAMAMEMPCIISKLAFDAFNILDENKLIVCNNETEYATQIFNLLTNKNKMIDLAKANRNFVQLNFNWESKGDQLFNLLFA